MSAPPVAEVNFCGQAEAVDGIERRCQVERIAYSEAHSFNFEFAAERKAGVRAFDLKAAECRNKAGDMNDDTSVERPHLVRFNVEHIERLLKSERKGERLYDAP